MPLACGDSCQGYRARRSGWHSWLPSIHSKPRPARRSWRCSAPQVSPAFANLGQEYGEDHAFWITWQDLEQAGVEVIHRCTELDDKADRDDDDDVTRCWLPARHWGWHLNGEGRVAS